MNTLKSILNKIKNFFLTLIITLIGLIKKIFKVKKKNLKQEISIKEKTKTITNKKQEIVNNSATPHDEDNLKSNNHIEAAETETTTNDIILELPKEKKEQIKINNKIEIPKTTEILNILIDEELEDLYKEDNFKIKEATKEIEEKIKELKERIIPKITIKIEKKKLNNQAEIKKEVREKIEEDLKENPLFTKIDNSKNNKEKNIYSLVIPKKKEINIKKETKKINTKEIIITTQKKEAIKKKLDETNIIMSKNIDEIPEQTIKEKITEASIIGTLTTAKIVKEILTNSNSEKNKTAKVDNKKQNNIKQETQKKEEFEKKETDTNLIKENNTIIELPKLNEKKEEEKTETLIIEQEQIKKDIETKTHIQENEGFKKNEIEKIEDKTIEKKEKFETNKIDKTEQNETTKELINESKIDLITKKSKTIIDESNKEIKKEEFEEKDYDKIEYQINKMLDDITNTYLRYENKMNEKQKKKLKKEEDKLRNTKDLIKLQKEKDIQIEIGKLTENIKESELTGLQNELENIEKQNKQEVNENFLKKINKLEGMTKEQVANVDKRIMLKRFNKASLLLEMTSLLSLPFVRNKYFFYFTIGLIIDNHFNFVNAFFNRQINKYEPADLSQIKKGQDALNGALDITYKNIVELDYLEEQALSRYPELAYDPRFIQQVTHLRTQLNKKYNKLMKKNKVMEKYYTKTKKHIKILQPKKEY